MILLETVVYEMPSPYLGWVGRVFKPVKFMAIVRLPSYDVYATSKTIKEARELIHTDLRGSPNRMELNMVKEEVGLEVVGEKGNNFIVKVSGIETFVEIENTFAEMFSRMEISPANPPFSVSFPFSFTFRRSRSGTKHIQAGS